MAKNGIYGIESIKIQNATAGAFPSAWTSAFEIKGIVKGSLSFNDQAAGDEDIEVEDMKDPYATLPSSLASEGFVIQTYEMSEDAYEHLCGYEADSSTPSTGWYTENPDFVLGPQAVQIITKAFGEFPSKTFEWANMACKVTKTGTIGKSGFPNFNLEFKKQSVINSDGEVIGGARWKYTA